MNAIASLFLLPATTSGLSFLQRYAEAVAARDRGLTRVQTPGARVWLLRIKADALKNMNDPAGARRVLEAALVAAREIGPEQIRTRRIHQISAELHQLEGR